MDLKMDPEGKGVKRHERQVERAVPGVPGLRVAVYPSGRRTYIYRYRNPVTKRKSAITLGEVT